MKSSIKGTPRDVANILDSDDELPDSYEETSEIPAYLNDSRFDRIELPWLQNCKPVKLSENTQQKPAPLKLESKIIEEPVVKIEKDKSKILISQGILTARDLFFIRSIEEYCSESTLIWFIESLKNKAVPDRFYKSCLAKDVYSVNVKDVEIEKNTKTNYYFNLVVSNVH